MTATVLLVDDHSLIREGLRRAFERTGEFEVVGEADSVAQAFDLVTAVTPDVAIVDVRLPDGSGMDAARRLRTEHPTLGIVVLTMYAGDEQLLGAHDAGASAFVPKDAPAQDVVAAARHAVAKPCEFMAQGLEDALQRRSLPTGPQLSPREQEVLDLLAEGLGVAAISRQLYISDSTTKTHVSRVYDKLGAGNRAQALMTALRLGLIATPSALPRRSVGV